MNRRLASLLLLVMMLGSGAYATPSPRVTNGVRVEIAFHLKRSPEIEIEQRIKAEFDGQRQTIESSDSPTVRSQTGKALYQRPPPATR